MRVERTLSVVDPQDPVNSARHLRIQIDTDTDARSVRAALARLAPKGAPLFAGATMLTDDGTLDDLPLPTGTAIGFGGPMPPLRIERPWTHLELRVVGGPAAGRVFPLPPGEHGLGRSGRGLVIGEDGQISRQHLGIKVSADGLVEVADLGSSNGTMLDGELLEEPAVIEPGALLQVGTSLLELAESASQDLPLNLQPDGRLGFNRRFRAGNESLPTEVAFPSKPGKSERPGLNLLMVLGPMLLIGVLMLVMRATGAGGGFGGPMLMFMLMSPLLGLGGGLARRRQWDAKHKSERSEFIEQSHAATTRLTNVRLDESRRLRHATPDPATVVLCARTSGRQLWARRASDPDLLTLRVGSGQRRSEVRAQGAHADDAFLWMTPVAMSLPKVGGISVNGPMSMARAAARSLVLQAATLHSPAEVRIVVITAEPAEADWGWVRWLPHAKWNSDDPFVLVGNDPTSTRLRLRELQDLVKRRKALLAEKANRILVPQVVVVYDGAAALVQQGFAEIIREGREVGIYSICIDESQVPEGCNGQITLDKRVDRTIVEEAGAPTQEQVIADLVAPDLCDTAARCLAPLTLVGEDGAAELPPQLRLLDVLNLDNPTPEAVLGVWANGGRTPAAAVGLTTSGPLLVDLTRDGPHGVIAGASRSGKSEFLKTFIASLAAANHPDNLSFLFIDFKGGNDYLLAAQLPHTVDLATQVDQSEFERALRLLDAEIIRRQQIAARAETSTIEGYWSAQAKSNDTSLPVMGRLVVIVDEFAELAQKNPEQLDNLVSVARTGAAYGVHLILATQRPAGVVSGQIDANAPLRVCFRTTQPEHSSDVLGVPDAAHIAERHRGRGFKRAHNEPLNEFQCARVGNARPGTAASVAPIEMARFDWATAGHIPPEPESVGEVPDPETDFYSLVLAIQEAAKRTGWTKNAVPWPKALPAVVNVANLPKTPKGKTPLVPFALLDDTEQQAHLSEPLVFGAGHVGLAGSAGTGRTTALRTAAVSAALTLSPADLHIYALDFPGGGLSNLSLLPHTVGLGSGDPEVIGRICDRLDEEIRDRRAAFEARGAGDLAEFNTLAAEDERLPWMLLLIDGWDLVHEDAQSPTGVALHDRLLRLLGDGTRYGLQGVVGGDRWVVTGRLGRVITRKYMLRFNATVDYDAAGVRSSLVPEKMPSGRCLNEEGRQFQIAVLGDGSGASQAAVIRDIAEELRTRANELPSNRRPRRIEAMPTRVSIERLVETVGVPDNMGLGVLLGFSTELSGGRWIDLAREAPTFVLTGRRKSGRTTALLSFAHSALMAGGEVVVVAPKDSVLTGLEGVPGVRAVYSGDAALVTMLPDASAGGPVLVLVDDADVLDPQHPGLVQMLSAPQPGRAVVVAATTEFSKNAMSGFLTTAKRARNGLILLPESPYDGGAIGSGNLPRQLVFDQPAGRGVLSLAGELSVLQVATPD